MRIHGMTVSVNYADLLSRSIAFWRSQMESLTIVTDLQDDETAQLASDNGCACVRTDAFTRHGAAFNKGLAQQEAWSTVNKVGWILLFDADIIPPVDWKEQVIEANPKHGYLHGCYRYDENGNRINDDTHGYGYFQLFHGSDELTKFNPFFDTQWQHAGNGDSSIMLRWRKRGRLAPVLPLKLLHPGGPSHNWYGRGEREKFRAMERERVRRGGGWESLEGEKINQ